MSVPLYDLTLQSLFTFIDSDVVFEFLGIDGMYAKVKQLGNIYTDDCPYEWVACFIEVNQILE